MIKYYRVIKEHPMWEKGAVLHNPVSSSQYIPVENIWNRVDKNENYYEAATIVEAPENCSWFERVYKDSVSGHAFKTLDQMKKLYKESFVV